MARLEHPFVVDPVTVRVNESDTTERRYRLTRRSLFDDTPASNLRCMPYCMGFRNLRPKENVTTRIAAPMMPFRILGLMVWGATSESWIVHCTVRNIQHVLGSSEPVPARFFETGLSFAELSTQLLDDDDQPLPVRPSGSVPLEAQEFFRGWLARRPEVERRQLFEFDTLYPSDQLTLSTSGPLHQLVLWGLAIRT